MSETNQNGAHRSQSIWLHASAAACGASHAYRGMPCQDAAISSDTPRPFCLAVDGRGSSDLSQHAARGAVAQIGAILTLLDPPIACALDTRASTPEERDARWTRAAQWIAWFLADHQRSLAEEIGCSSADLEYTLALVAVGSECAGWLQVGDAAIVADVGGTVGLVESPKVGEFANETEFLTHPLRASTVRSGLVPAARLQAVAVCSDGMAFHFVDLRTSEPTEAFAQIFEAVADRQCSSTELEALLAAPRWFESHADDRCLAVLARCRDSGKPQVHAETEPGGTISVG